MKDTDFATSLTAMLERAADSILDDIAKDGLVVLKQTLDDAGFGESEYLKNYQVFSHIDNDELTFEIRLDLESVDDRSKDKIRKISDDDIRKYAKTFALAGGPGNHVVRVQDSRKKSSDTKREPKHLVDSRKTRQDRLAEHQLRQSFPRNMMINQQGQLLVMLQKQMKQTTSSIRLPSDDFEGIIGKFMTKLKKVVLENFEPKLKEIIGRFGK